MTNNVTLEYLQALMVAMPEPIKETTVRCGSLAFQYLLRKFTSRQVAWPVAFFGNGSSALAGLRVEKDASIPAERVELGYYDGSQWVATKCWPGLD